MRRMVRRGHGAGARRGSWIAAVTLLMALVAASCEVKVPEAAPPAPGEPPTTGEPTPALEEPPTSPAADADPAPAPEEETTTTAPAAATTTTAPLPAPEQPTTTTAPPAPTTTTAPPPAPMPPAMGTPWIDVDRIPTGSPGHPDVRVGYTDDVPGPGDDGAFRNVCDFSHMNFDDPLVFPGQPGAAHLHAYFGNTGVDHRSTAQSIATTGNSTCRGGIINRTAYWVPAIIDTRTGAPVRPIDMIVYYKSGYVHEPHEIQPHPTGLRMIGGDPSASGPQEHAWFRCGDDGRATPQIPAGCPGGEVVIMSVQFPQCWNGRDLDAPDHRSHMSYPEDHGCPASHPIPLPVITYNVAFAVDGGDTGAWRLASDAYPATQPGGYSAHADWWDGWVPEFKEEWVRECTSVPVTCHAHLLGPNREIY